MRIVRFQEERAGGVVLALHPNLTVVQGLPGARRAALVESLVSLVNGRTQGLAGVVEAHGVLLDIGPDGIRTVLGLGTEAIDPVVRPGDLPGEGHGVTLAAARRRHAERTVAELRERLDVSDAAVVDARRRCQVAARHLAQGTSSSPLSSIPASGPSTELATRTEAVRAAQAAVVEARRRLDALVTDPAFSDRLSAARARRATATDALAASLAEVETAGADIDHDAERVLNDAHAALVNLQTEYDLNPPNDDRTARLADLRAALPALALRLVRHQNAVDRIARIEGAFAELQAEEQVAMQQVARVRTDHTFAQAELRGRLRVADAELAAAKAALADATATSVGSPDGSPGGVGATAPDPVRVQMERRLLVARIDLGGAQAASELLRAEWDAQRRRLEGDVDPAGTAKLRRTEAEAEEDARRDELEWYLLSRIAQQRAVGVAGSIPLVLDDTFSRQPPGTAPSLLDRLLRLVDAVQVIVLSDDPELAAWTEIVPAGRAALVDVADGPQA